MVLSALALASLLRFISATVLLKLSSISFTLSVNCVFSSPTLSDVAFCSFCRVFQFCTACFKSLSVAFASLAIAAIHCSPSSVSEATIWRNPSISAPRAIRFCKLELYPCQYFVWLSMALFKVSTLIAADSFT